MEKTIAQELKECREECRALKKGEDGLLVRIADAHIEANRFRKRYEDALVAYKQLRVDTGRLCLTAIIVGAIIGAVVGLIIGLMF